MPSVAATFADTDSTLESTERRDAAGSVAAYGWFLVAPGQPLQWRAFDVAAPGPSEVIVAVEACGLCHTDLAYADGSVRTNHALPLVLGHEVVGRVVGTGRNQEHWLGRRVIVPAVLPCGVCAFCRCGRGNACPHQTMPGNDSHGGLATHLKVPAAPLVDLAGSPTDRPTWPLAVVADAVSTAWQAVRRAAVVAGDGVAVVGAGGVGGFVAQIARSLGAHVLALDVRDDRLAELGAIGLDGRAVRDRAPTDVRREVHGWLAGHGATTLQLKVFECSGTVPGQALAFGLLGRGATLVQVGFTPQPVELRFSNLMAFDATVHGSWGCPPAQYAGVLDLIDTGAVVLDPFVEMAPLGRLNDLLADMAGHRLTRRMVLCPEA